MSDTLGLDVEDEGGVNLSAYVPIDKMIRVHDKLHFLNYEEEFIKLTKLPRLHRLYFVHSTNSGEQYYNFVVLCAWLINKANRKMETPHEYDDPNDVIYKILGHIKDMGGLIDFSVSKLKPGSGADAISVLDFLTDRALQGYTFDSMVIPEENEMTVEDNSHKEINLAQIEEEMALLYEEDWKEDEVQQVISAAPFTSSIVTKSPVVSQNMEKPEDQRLIESNVSIEDWRLELERVLPQLAQPINTEDGLSWRTRMIQMSACVEEMKDVLGETKKPLMRLKDEVKESLEKVHGRESNLNSHLEGSMAEFLVNNGFVVEVFTLLRLQCLLRLQKRLQDIREKQRQITNEVNEKNRTLAKLSDDVEAARRKLEERGNMMADGAPVAQARKDLTTLKREISDMDVEIGVMEHCILKSMVQEQISLFEHRK